MLIYRILNLIDGKSYVGQTIFPSFLERYGKKWYESTHNQYLKDSARKHGPENFAVHILEENISSVEELNKKEKFYIKKYNCLAPYGYNFREGGLNGALHPETKKKLSEAQAREFFFVDYNGKEYHVINLKKFCESNKLLYAAMKNMASGKVLTSNGFALKGTDISIIKNPNVIHRLKNLQTGEIIEFDNVSKFSKDNGFSSSSISKLLANEASIPYKNYANLDMDLSLWNQKQKILNVKLRAPTGEIIQIDKSAHFFALDHPPLRKEDVYALFKKTAIERKGWRLAETTDTDLHDFRENKKQSGIYIFEKDGLEITINNMTKFCEERNLNYSKMFRLVNQPNKTYEGYNFKSRVKTFKYLNHKNLKIKNIKTEEIILAVSANELWNQVKGKIAKNKMYALIRKKIDKVGDWVLS